MPQDTALHKAANENDKDGVQDELAKGTNVDEPGAQGRTALHRALGAGYVDLARFLIVECKADPLKDDAMKRSSLHWASMAPSGSKDCCELLFELNVGKAMLNKQSKSDSTPLHCAISASHVDTAKFLVEQQPDLKLQDEDGKTPFALAKAAKLQKEIPFPKGTK